jgi:3-deoxy-manno-octulosonate cytidylyltransferase (CMP-KDO synthetase)
VLALDAADVFVATDDERIASHCESFGAQVLMTSTDCLTGTDRVNEAAQQITADVYINVQGDEPLLDPVTIDVVLAEWSRHPNSVVNAMSRIDDEADYRSTTVPHVVASPDGRLLYMSRAAIPANKELAFRIAWRQVCVYAFPPAALAAFASCRDKTPLEQMEDIEILRFLELGIPVRMVTVASGSVAVDVPDDVVRVEAILARQGEAP